MNKSLITPLEAEDKEVFSIIEFEKYRQYTNLELIASENFTSRAVMEANGSPLTNKYSEGLPNARYYGGNQFIDQLENLCRQRALELFGLSSDKWGVNVQSYSGSTANFSAYTAILKPNDKLMGLDLPSGGHLTHGYATPQKKISSSAIYFDSKPYKINQETGLIDYDELRKLAGEFKPKLIICGASAYPRDLDYKSFREIADGVGAYLMADISHISGLVASKIGNNPFEYCDLVTTTTHKTLRGPRAALIFFRRAPRGEKLSDLEEKVNFAVFPSNQGGPHNNTIAAVAVALKQANTPEFREYMQQTVKNSRALAEELKKKGQTLISDGTDNHLILWNVKKSGITGSKMEKICEHANITLNKNSVIGDTSSINPGGVRVGTSALTSRGFKENDFVRVASFLISALELALEIQSRSGPKLKDFEALVKNDNSVKALRAQVSEFAKKFPMPGFDESKILEFAKQD